MLHVASNPFPPCYTWPRTPFRHATRGLDPLFAVLHVASNPFRRATRGSEPPCVVHCRPPRTVRGARAPPARRPSSRSAPSPLSGQPFARRPSEIVIVSREVRGEIVLFIDEVHTVVGAGAGDGAMDAGNLLKPALARGQLRCVGATTLDEYRQYIEKDAALERRFQQVYFEQPLSHVAYPPHHTSVGAPWHALTTNLLYGRCTWISRPLRPPPPSSAGSRSATSCTMACPSPTAPWSPPPSSPTGNLPAPTSYMTTYNPATLSWCLLATSATLPSTFPAFLLIDTWRGVSTRGRYIADRFLPDKAIDLVDEAAAKLRIDATSRPQVLDEVSRKLLHHLAAPLSPQQAATPPCCTAKSPAKTVTPPYCTAKSQTHRVEAPYIRLGCGRHGQRSNGAV